MRTVDEVRGLQDDGLLAGVAICLRAALRDDFRVVHFGVTGNHLLLVVEAKEAHALAKGMQGLSIRVARAVNRHYGRKGKLWADRYHARVLKTPREVRDVLDEVLDDTQPHGVLPGARSWLLRVGWRKA